ncbi:MBL fold metallo-hydrolase [Allohahella marinimesophila]|uniref:MBL fold metallo-hydrolase n=1 Tax=Allohahella marinimesophila TaxID=1054972 RepID=A0ABP7NHX2_9GAMM
MTQSKLLSLFNTIPRRASLTLLLSCVLVSGTVQAQRPESKAEAAATVGYSLIRTARSTDAKEMLVVSGGSWLKDRQLQHNVVLIQHPQGDLLLDTGLGRNVDTQVEEMSWIHRQLLAYADVHPLMDQLEASQYDFARLHAVIPTHMHWDHVSGLEDLPSIPVWVTTEEHDFAVKSGEAPAFLRSQFDSPAIQWDFLQLDSQPYEGFERSRDVFGDGTVIIVSLAGHTPGQVGVFLNLASGNRLFFIGDTTWTAEGVERKAPRPAMVQWLAGIDWDREQNQAHIERINALAAKDSKLTIVPAHDENVAARLVQFPEFAY